ncbi:MAG: putative lipid II flippase FtsW, partial [Actinomycetales bacterium]|nr:putative lipid II flippase FtsW [Actinomycetales bacterium]
MSSSAVPGRPAAMASLRSMLQRPLASYHIVLGTTLMLIGLGLIMVLSASSVNSLRMSGNSYGVFVRQLVFTVMGAGVMWLAVSLPLNVVRRLSFPFMLVVFALIAATFTPLGIEVNGNRNWLPLVAGVRLQPSEFAKLAIVIWMAHMFAAQHGRMKTFMDFISPVGIVVIAMAGLVIGQKDIGTALILFAIILGMFWVAGFPMKAFAVILSVLVGAMAFFVGTAPHRIARLMSFWDPMADPEGAGYQVVKATMGFARGGFWGLGLGNSRQKWGALPEAHTDFILAVIGEELGLMGGLVILGLFAMLGYAGYRIVSRSKDRFARYLAAGITLWLMTQAVVNIAMVLKLLPVIGVPLPLISYGGSSLLVTMAALGLLANCAKTEPGAARALKLAKKPKK